MHRLLSALEHHHWLGRGVKKEMAVLAKGLERWSSITWAAGGPSDVHALLGMLPSKSSRNAAAGVATEGGTDVEEEKAWLMWSGG